MRYIVLIRKIILLISTFSTFFARAELVISVPKCGTHLLTNCLEEIHKIHKSKQRYISRPSTFISYAQIPDNHLNDNIYYLHTFGTQEAFQRATKYDMRPVFITRDPRDMIISYAHFLHKYLSHY